MSVPYVYLSPTVPGYAQAIIDQYNVWYSARQLVSVYTGLRSLNVMSDAGRSVGANLIANMVVTPPYAIRDNTDAIPFDIRFSASSNSSGIAPNAWYVAAFADGWAGVFESLLKALQTPVAAGDTPYDPVGAFYDALAAMSCSIRNRTGFYNVYNFEDIYGLTWGAPPTSSN